jgi:predicted nucleotidyltransferase
VRAAPSLAQIRRSGRCVAEEAFRFAEALARSCSHALGETVAGVILHGSLTGRLGPGRSDVDLLVIVEDPLSEGSWLP